MNSMQILLVEDNIAICDAMAELLQLEGHTVKIANNGKLALDYLQSKDRTLPDLILLDLMMPVMDGVEFLKAQRADVTLASIPVFIMTANGVPLDMEKYNIISFLRKPVDFDKLFAALRDF